MAARAASSFAKNVVTTIFESGAGDFRADNGSGSAAAFVRGAVCSRRSRGRRTDAAACNLENCRSVAAKA